MNNQSLRKVEVGRLYRHFKKTVYKVGAIAQHTGGGVLVICPPLGGKPLFSGNGELFVLYGSPDMILPVGEPFFAMHTETTETNAIFRVVWGDVADCPPPEEPAVICWARPMENFLETLEKEGKNYYRFELI